MRFKNLVLIGTSHIASQSLKEVEEGIEREKPGIIALELDKRRFLSLMSAEKKRPGIGLIRTIGITGYLFSLIGGWLQEKLGKYAGVSPGSEMRKAIMLAAEKKIDVVLIDQDIVITMRRLSRMFSWRQKLRLGIDLLKGIFFRKKVMKELGFDIDLTKVPEKRIIKKVMDMMRKSYPNLYKVLVEERNGVMAGNLAALMKNHPDKKILAIVGAGHEESIMRRIRKDFSEKEIDKI